jgi:hypothetical protein
LSLLNSNLSQNRVEEEPRVRSSLSVVVHSFACVPLHPSRTIDESGSQLKTSLRELYQSKTMDVPDLVAELKELQLDALKMLSATIATPVVPHSSPSSCSPTASRISSIPAPSRKVVEIRMEQLVLTHFERVDEMDETLAFDDE